MESQPIFDLFKLRPNDQSNTDQKEKLALMDQSLDEFASDFSSILLLRLLVFVQLLSNLLPLDDDYFPLLLHPSDEIFQDLVHDLVRARLEVELLLQFVIDESTDDASRSQIYLLIPDHAKVCPFSPFLPVSNRTDLFRYRFHDSSFQTQPDQYFC